MTLAFPGRGTQQDAKSPGGFWSVLGELLSTAARWATKGNANLDLILTSKEELVRDVKVSVSLGCRDTEMGGSHVPTRVRKESRRVQMSGIRGADFGLFWGALVGISWSAALKGSRAQYSLRSRTASSQNRNGLCQNSVET